ncbi:MAG: hypothetical protein IIU35_01315 [Neisseriaceae bacterium]|nr:hypothetical protein [Neisseriaceae bacterium]
MNRAWVSKYSNIIFRQPENKYKGLGCLKKISNISARDFYVIEKWLI